MQRSFILLLLIGMLAVALWWLARDPAGTPELAASAAASSSAGQESAPEAGGGSPAVDGEVAREARTTTSDGDVDSDLAETVVLKVVRMAGGAGVSEVRIRFVDFDAPESATYRTLTRDRYLDREIASENYGQVRFTDLTGNVRLPRVAVGLVFARLKGEFATTFLDLSTPDGTELILQRDLELRVRVVDQDGAPVAGAPVAWLAWSGDRANAQVRARSGTDGLAQLLHLQTRFPPHPSQRHSLALNVPGGMAGQVPFDPLNLPAEPVELRLPPHGSVAVEVLDADGRAFPDDTPVFLQEALSAEQRSDWTGYKPSPATERGASLALTENGVASFAHVGVGVRLEYGALFEDAGRYFGAESEGLAAPGQDLRLILRLPETPTRIHGRILRPDRTAIANARINCELESEHMMQGHVLQTDAEGRFSLFVDEQEAPPSSGRAAWMAYTDPDVRRTLAHRLNLTDGLGPGNHDFGDVILGDGSPLAAGRVVDDAGEPLAGVRVSIEIFRNGVSRSSLQLLSGPRRIANLTGPDGRFALHASGAPAADWHLYFKLEGYLPVDLAGLSGREDHEVVLQRAARLRGQLLIDPGIPADLLRLSWRRQGEEKSRQWVEVRLDRELRFVTDDVDPGMGDLSITALRRSEILALVKDVALGSAAEPDPRLNPLDLRGRLHYSRIRVLDAAGREPGIVSLIFEGEKREYSSYWQNPVRLLMPESGRRCTVLAAGSASAALTLDRPELEARLSAGIPVSIKLEGIAWPQDGVGLKIYPDLLGTGGLDDFDAMFDATGRAQLILPEAGRYGLVLSIILARDGAPVSSFDLRDIQIPGSERPEFDVAASQPHAEIRINVAQEVWDRALRVLNNPFPF